uniref:NadR/Ttd14 AAA domain-containing protein n=1 Tax=Arcella intermedia TaxID=1963864 RepID=A0A6B2L5P0_9EUKA
MRSLGFKVFNVPEVASIFINGGGIKFSSITEDEVYVFQLNLIKTMMVLEDAFYNIASSTGQPSVIISDRGTMDPAAYMSRDQWQVVLDESKWNLVDLRDRRYDAVLHLVTAALGAEKFYTTENNTARTETLTQAQELDQKILNAWIGHPELKIIDNSTDFQGKMTRITNTICQVVGAPRPAGTRRKFIATDVDINTIKAAGVDRVEQFQVEQTYLTPYSPSESSPETNFQYLRRRGQKDSFSYTHHSQKSYDNNRSIFLSRAISGRDYLTLLKQADPARVTVTKDVKYFIWNNTYFELENYKVPNIGLSSLVVETDQPAEVIEFPPFIKVKGEVTSEPAFFSYSLAKTFKNNPSANWKYNEQLLQKYLVAKMSWMRRAKVQENTK